MVFYLSLRTKYKIKQGFDEDIEVWLDNGPQQITAYNCKGIENKAN